MSNSWVVRPSVRRALLCMLALCNPYPTFSLYGTFDGIKLVLVPLSRDSTLKSADSYLSMQAFLQ